MAGVADPPAKVHSKGSRTTAPVEDHDTLGIDVAGVLTLEQARRVAAQSGASFFAAYLGGPYNGGYGWTRDHILELQSVFTDGCLPIYVGQQRGNEFKFQGNLTAEQGRFDGQQALSLLDEWGFAPGTLIALDVESNTYDERPAECAQYVNAWVATVRGGGYVPGVYGSPRCLPNVDKDFGWLAKWDGIDAPEGYEMHQFEGETLEGGVGVDLDVHQAHGLTFALLS